MRQDMTREAAEEILELPRRYTKEDLKHAYTELARTYHPDAASKGHLDPAEAQRIMVEANKANATLKPLFADEPDRVVERVGMLNAGVFGGYEGVDWRAGAHADVGDEDPWSFVDEWTSEPAPEKVPLCPRSVLLGPVLLRVLFIAVFAFLWWRTFPLLSHNLGRYVPAGSWTFYDVFVLVAGMVYPSYLLVYESLTGYLSNFVREILNGAVSWLTRRYLDLRPHTPSYGCALYKLMRNQVYALLMGPLVLWLASCSERAQTPLGKVAFCVLAVVLGIDTLAACVHGGYINTWTSALAERVEARYLLLRASLLRRCGKWGASR